mmetsp:Transcript_6479/g.11192  ORF Transcript_6479/g.11192 Transcript_6479/m.11192 type:complete len:245 (-) Transcript_6479:637-1371(-)
MGISKTASDLVSVTEDKESDAADFPGDLSSASHYLSTSSSSFSSNYSSATTVSVSSSWSASSAKLDTISSSASPQDGPICPWAGRLYVYIVRIKSKWNPYLSSLHGSLRPVYILELKAADETASLKKRFKRNQSIDKTFSLNLKTTDLPNIHISLLNHRRHSVDTLLGSLDVDVSELLAHEGAQISGSYPLIASDKEIVGEIEYAVRFQPFAPFKDFCKLFKGAIKMPTHAVSISSQSLRSLRI